MLNVYEQFINMLRCGVCGSQLPQDSYDWNEILRLAHIHRVEAILWYALRERKDVPAEIQKKLKACWDLEIVRDVRQDYASEQIRKKFQEQKIDFAPMKGLVLKLDYPFPHMRYMSDLDFYVQTGDRSRIHSCMEQLNAVVSGTDSGDVNYELPGRVQLEFHGRLLYRAEATGVICYSDWSRMNGDENRLTEEGYALNLIGHIAYNIAHAGCGARFILDLWVYRHKHQQQPDWTAVMQQLKADGLERIARNLLDLSEYWFGGGKGSPLLDDLGTYILEGGLYGLASRETLSDAGLNGGKLSAIKVQVFRSKEEFQNRYSWLKNHPYLLPLAWGMRGIHSLKTHRKEIGRWVRRLNQNDSKEIWEQRDRLRRFGILK